MTDKPDDLDAVRTIADTLSSFDPETQSRVIRWACERVGVTSPVSNGGGESRETSSESSQGDAGTHNLVESGRHKSAVDIKSFVASKSPSSNNEFAACVAYFYRFEAPEKSRKNAIDGSDLQEACRLAGRERLGRPNQTLVNAHQAGLVDQTDERGKYTISTVGENLVAMTLPSDGSSKKRAQSQAGKKSAKKKAATKKTNKKPSRKKKASGKTKKRS